jgi:hypothetical protein
MPLEQIVPGMVITKGSATPGSAARL